MSGPSEGDGKAGPVDFQVDQSVWLFLRDTLATHLKQDPGGLRVSVRGGGCSGLAYHFEMTPQREGDYVFNAPESLAYIDWQVYVDRRSMLFLKGSVLVYEKGDFASLLKLRNPNAKSTCGCGESFSV